jgi:site-specific recombinase XerD
MAAYARPLDADKRRRIVAEFAARPPSEHLLGRLLILDAIPVHEALRARVGDLDIARRTLALTDKRGHERTVALDDTAVELAALVVGARSATNPLFVSGHGKPLTPERARETVAAAARRAGLPASLAALRPGILIPA